MNEMPARPNNLESFWMPFTANRAYKAAPRLLARAEGMLYYTSDGREIIDGTAGLWCVNAGHGRREITEAIQRQAATMDFAPTFQLGHPVAFQAAAKVAEHTPAGRRGACATSRGSRRSGARRGRATAPAARSCSAPASRWPTRCTRRWRHAS